MMPIFKKFEINNTLKVGSIGDISDFKKGISYKSLFLDPYNENVESKFFISLANFKLDGGFKFGKMKYYFGPYKDKDVIHPFNLLAGATDITQERKVLGAPIIIPNLAKDMLYSLDVFKVDVDNKFKYWLYMQMRTDLYRNQIENSATGTTVLRVPQKVIKNIRITIPNNKQLSKFNSLISPLFNLKNNIFNQNQSLIKLRNKLLQRLF